MQLKWNNTNEIAEMLYIKYPHIDPKTISFVKMHDLICSLENFNDNKEASNETILEQIFLKWLDEYDYYT
uniref:Fe-S cluster assembly protein IscX n=1 Tax=Candidatus Aschnera chinzeii TaxID=1485666 RepID=A0AAT9G436_9ENTR|nr:MAG: Fe-S cluster assembly protein IscX [Candidatus Aschnera chinzeii]